jgi:hypothetical protein
LPERYFVSGQGADTVFGLNYSRKLKGLQAIGHIPEAARLLKGLGTLLGPRSPASPMLLRGAAILATSDDPNAFLSPVNSIAVYVDWSCLRRCFGDQVLRTALQFRREFVAQYLRSDHYLEKVHVIDLLTDTYELGVQRQQLFLANRREQLHPFFDDDVLQAGFAFSPERRYIKGLRSKYLLKELLEQTTSSRVARQPKGYSTFDEDLLEWMRSGPLRPLVQEIQLPGFMSRVEFDRLLGKPDYFLWVLLGYDLFRRRCLSRDC